MLDKETPENRAIAREGAPDRAAGISAAATAVVETSRIGAGTQIWGFTHIQAGAVLGANCSVGSHCFVENGVTIGNDVTIKNGNLLWDGLTIEDGVFIGPGVLFTNDRYPRSRRLPQAAPRYVGRHWLVPTRVRHGASLGAGAIVLPGVTVGPYAMVGAGSVVTSAVPAHALVVGNPARVRGWVCQCGEPVGFERTEACCGRCGLSLCIEDEISGPR